MRKRRSGIETTCNIVGYDAALATSWRAHIKALHRYKLARVALCSISFHSTSACSVWKARTRLAHEFKRHTITYEHQINKNKEKNGKKQVKNEIKSNTSNCARNTSENRNDLRVRHKVYKIHNRRQRRENGEKNKNRLRKIWLLRFLRGLSIVSFSVGDSNYFYFSRCRWRHRHLIRHRLFPT